MPSITNLIPDIYSLVQSKGGWFNDELAQSFSRDISSRLKGQLGQRTDRPTLRLSAMGPRCPRALWYSIYHPEMAEPLPPWAQIKYTYGHIIEGLIINLAKAAGHRVEGIQDELKLDGIVGHRDCVIDGCTVDVKSSTGLSFQKYKKDDFELVDSFGYLDQLDGYGVAALDDPLVINKEFAYLLAVNQERGHLYLYEHKIRPDHIRARISSYKHIVNLPSPPACECKTKPYGTSGNICLDTKASYSAYKYCCFPHLRTFIYSHGPLYLTEVRKRPTNQWGLIPEVDKLGRPVFN